MKIKEVTLKNFKSFKNLKIKPEHAFGNVNLVFGYNNSGKSNLLKFLYILFKKKYGGKIVTLYHDDGSRKDESIFEEGAVNFWMGQVINSNFLFTNNITSDPIKFSVTFEESKSALPNITSLNKIYNDNNIFIVEGEFVYQKHNVSNVNLLKCIFNGIDIFHINEGMPIYFQSIALLKNDSTMFEQLLGCFNDSVILIESDRYFSTESERPENRVLTAKNFKNWLYQLYLDPFTYEQYEKLLLGLENFKPKAPNSKPLLASNLKNYPLNDIDLGFSKTSENLSIMLNANGRYPIENYGTGIQQIMYILAKFFTSNPKVFLIEELELNLSPEYQYEILNYLKSLCDLKTNNLEQIIFTSHSGYMAKNTNVDKFYVVTINDNGESNTRLLPRDAVNVYFDSLDLQNIFPVS